MWVRDTAFGATVLAASSVETDSYEEELSTAVLKNDLSMPVRKEEMTLGTMTSSAPSRLARSDTMEASIQSSLPNLGKFEPLSSIRAALTLFCLFLRHVER
eukprot:Skav213670  [mRNA]  locus=scaffold491:139133:140929:+ [translate_table: standard]